MTLLQKFVSERGAGLSYGALDAASYHGHGAAVAKHVGPQSPRDLGIRVPLSSQRH